MLRTMNMILIKLGVRLVVFTAVFWFAARKNKKVVFEKTWAPPLVGIVFAVLSTALFWAASKLLGIVTLGAVGFVAPLVINLGLVIATAAIFKSRHWFRIEGVIATVWMAVFVTVAHGALWLALDYIPAHA